MRLLAQNQIPHGFAEEVFRQGRFGVTLFALILSGVAGFFFFLGWVAISGWHLFAFSGFLGLIALLLIGAARATWKRSNWTVRAARDGLYINTRSYRNHHFPAEDAVVAYVPYREMETLRVLREHLITPGSKKGNTQHETRIKLEVRLRDPDTNAIAETIERERSRMPHGWIRSWSPHRPVEVSEPGVLLVHWRSGNSHLVPKIDRFLEAVAGKCPVAKEAPAATVDYRTMQVEELEQLAAKLARAGEKFQAIRLLSQKFGGSLTEAKQRLEKKLHSGE